GAIDALEQSAMQDAVQFAGLFSRTAAGLALAKFPLADLEEAAREILAHVRQAPHLVIRVNEALYEQAESLLKRTARERGFEGRLVILGEPDVPLGDFSIEWADGGVSRSSTAIQSTIDDILARHMQAAPADTGR
ncbi:MAG: FliH/SctL family protein, partial [Beijerinckiaceae bacterium]